MLKEDESNHSENLDFKNVSDKYLKYNIYQYY